MIRRTGQVVSIALIFALTAISLMAQNRPYNMSDGDMRNVARRIQERTDKMRRTFENESQNGSLKDYWRRTQFSRAIQDLQNKANDFSYKADQRRVTSNDAQEVLNKANKVDELFRNNNSYSNNLRNDWSSLSNEVDKLARAFYLNWNGGNYSGNYGNQYPNDYPNDYPNNYPNNSRRGEFLIPDNVSIVAVLNDDLSTKTVQEGERFTMTVESPSRYRGAVIEGYISDVNRSGRVSGRSQMTFNFQRIRHYGRTYKFAGTVEEVRVNGKNVNVDEGSVRDNSRTKTTIKRGAIGAGVGAIIGAIVGGGKGAAIGAVIGAGAGAGTVLIQGKDDLEITSGSEVTIRSSAPGYNNYR